jgi:hypothetical protein
MPHPRRLFQRTSGWRDRSARPQLNFLEGRLAPSLSVFNVPPGSDTLRAPIAQAEADGNIVDLLSLAAGSYTLSKAGGDVLIENTAGPAAKTLIIQGQGRARR